MYTTLSPAALPGRRYTFAPKAGASGDHTGLFTQLGASALPQARYTFSPKTGASGGHTGLFTQLSVMALPGGIRTFIAKAAAPETVAVSTGGGAWPYYQLRVSRDYDELDLEAIIPCILWVLENEII